MKGEEAHEEHRVCTVADEEMEDHAMLHFEWAGSVVGAYGVPPKWAMSYLYQRISVSAQPTKGC